MFVILIWTNVYPYMFTGPLAKQTRLHADGGQCAKYWWTNMLYINNFYPQEMGETVKDQTVSTPAVSSIFIMNISHLHALRGSHSRSEIPCKICEGVPFNKTKR